MSDEQASPPGMLEATERVASIALGAAGKHAERVVELEAEVSTLREHLAEQNRLLSLNVAEVERLRRELGEKIGEKAELVEALEPFDVVHERTDKRVGTWDRECDAQSHAAELNAEFPSGDGPYMAVPRTPPPPVEVVAEVHSDTLRWLVDDDHPVRTCGQAKLYWLPPTKAQG